MSFPFNWLTDHGQNLIARATVANPIVLTGGYISTESCDTQQKADSFGGWMQNPVGSIVSASATKGSAGVRVGFSNETITDMILARSFGLFGRLANGSGIGACMAIVSVPQDQMIIIQNRTSPPQVVTIGFNILAARVSQEIIQGLVDGGTAKVADLERFVSCHKAGDPNTGDAQSVRGQKIFKDNISAEAGLDSYSTTLTNGTDATNLNIVWRKTSQSADVMTKYELQFGPSQAHSSGTTIDDYTFLPSIDPTYNERFNIGTRQKPFTSICANLIEATEDGDFGTLRGDLTTLRQTSGKGALIQAIIVFTSSGWKSSDMGGEGIWTIPGGTRIKKGQSTKIAFIKYPSYEPSANQAKTVTVTSMSKMSLGSGGVISLTELPNTYYQVMYLAVQHTSNKEDFANQDGQIRCTALLMQD